MANPRWDESIGFRSRHPGAAGFLTCDGAVRFVDEGIDVAAETVALHPSTVDPGIQRQLLAELKTYFFVGGENWYGSRFGLMGGASRA